MPNAGVPPEQFRELLGRFATGVTVLTALSADRGAGRPIGMTANSLASVSLDPPLLSVSVDRQHEMHAAMEATSHFVVNILADDQEAWSRRFAGTAENRFDGVGYRESRRGIPLLDGALAHIECEKHAAIAGGDHTVFLGLVTGGAVTNRRPLLYYRGGYGNLGSD
ncbi:MAG TPA: flavin reductase family protein [Gemmatimonadales bacterium]|nr:flavin reductase family protein [Gemmatimonadales bacterium]